MRTTFKQVKDSRIAFNLGIRPEEKRFTQIVNEAQQRLLNMGEWHGTRGRYRFCVTDGCLTWPRQIAAIEAAAIDRMPIQIRNQWFEFLENGSGLRECDKSCDYQLFDRGTYCTFADISGANKKIKIYCDVAESPTARVLLQGYDENKNWIRTQDTDGSYIDGEYVALTANVVLSTKIYSSLIGVQKPETNGALRFYSFDTVTALQSALAIYEPDETTPAYRRSFIPGLLDGKTHTVTVLAKHEFIPVKNDTDYMIIGNIPALKLACMAIKKEEDGIWQEADYLLNGELKADRKRYNGAVQLLEEELSHYNPASTVVTLRTGPRDIWGAGAVWNVI